MDFKKPCALALALVQMLCLLVAGSLGGADGAGSVAAAVPRKWLPMMCFSALEYSRVQLSTGKSSNVLYLYICTIRYDLCASLASLTVLRWVKTGRLSMASTIAHHQTEKMRVNQVQI